MEQAWSKLDQWYPSREESCCCSQEHVEQLTGHLCVKPCRTHTCPCAQHQVIRCLPAGHVYVGTMPRQYRSCTTSWYDASTNVSAAPTAQLVVHAGPRLHSTRCAHHAMHAHTRSVRSHLQAHGSNRADQHTMHPIVANQLKQTALTINRGETHQTRHASCSQTPTRPIGATTYRAGAARPAACFQLQCAATVEKSMRLAGAHL
jgi:hypothetical protein